MNLIDLVFIALTGLYRRDNNNQKYYASLEVWLYLKEECKEDMIRLGYNLESFFFDDMDNAILNFPGFNNGDPFRVQKEPAEGGTYYCIYWIP